MSTVQHVKLIAAAGQFWTAVTFQANCNQTNAVTFGEYSQAWDFRGTAVGQLEVDVYSNTSKDPNAGNQSPPLNLRINQVCCLHS